MNKTFEQFKNDLGKRESGNRYQIVNKEGYMGCYQFGMALLADLGLTERIPGERGFANKNFRWANGYSKENFLTDRQLQDKCFEKAVKLKLDEIKKQLLSGLVAGSWLGGLGGIQKTLRGKSPKDSLGTSVTSYIKKFSGYDIDTYFREKEIKPYKTKITELEQRISKLKKSKKGLINSNIKLILRIIKNLRSKLKKCK